ncbi:MAG: ATP-dependent zinc metalloprotease FtsH [Spirochaetaceae bacterium]|jgi:cell division protease FtsH|nr:ATP-dependent zinc metalloprotease FtsH [Spirochaetaceae bacterium]
MFNDQNNNIPPRPSLQSGRPNRFALIFFLIMVGLFMAYFFKPKAPAIREIPYSAFTTYLEMNEVTAVTIHDSSVIEGTLRDKSYFKTLIPYQDPGLLPELRAKNINVSGAAAGISPWRIFLEFLPWLIGFGFIWIMFRNMQGSGNKAFQFGKSRAKRYQDEGKKTTFADVAGQDDAKYELQEVVAFLRDPQKFTKMGARIPKGVLLVGMPGTGKTLMAKAVAGEAGVAYFHMSGSDFVEMFVGVGASRVRDLFDQGRRSAPCIIFIDELDAVGRTRGAGYGGGHDEREQTLNQLLVEMDGFDSKDGVIILAATNRPDVLDPALLRPGRFDRQVTVAMPDIKERESILKIHAAKIPLAQDVDLARIARATPGMSGAEIANLVNEAALFAARKDKTTVGMPDFEEARDKVLMGVARKTLAISDKERRMTAIHEAGHAMLHYFLKNADPLHKVTIVPHGRALGMALSLPEEDSYSRTKGWILDRIVICYGGWVAERLFYDETTTGTKQDLEQATDMARRMVCEWGMADEVGPITYGQEEEPIFLGKEIARHKDYSEETAQNIDRAIKKILGAAQDSAEAILKSQKAELERLADALISRETLTDDEVRVLLGLPPREKGTLPGEDESGSPSEKGGSLPEG